MSGASTLDPQLRVWRWRIFAATWLGYFGYYFCRKPFNIAKADLIENHGWTDQTVGNIGAIYLFTYVIGQFAAGWAGNRFGARAVLLIGMSITIVVNAAFGVADSAWTFGSLMALNGLVQATGWSACVGTMGRWFHRGERASVMGPWATNFQIGSFLAGPFAAWMLGMGGYRWSFFGGSLVTLGVLAIVALNQRNRPEDVGLPPVEDPQVAAGTAAAEQDDDEPLSRAVLFNIALIGTFYFFSKLIRYAFWSWVPLLLNRHFQMSGEDAGYMSSIFDAAGFLGTIAAGLLADRVFRGSLSRLSFYFTTLMVLSMSFLYFGGTASLPLFGLGIGLVGFFLFGPDALLTGAGAVNLGSPRKAALAAGLISGIGSVGPIVQELVLPRFVGDDDPSVTFGLLLVSALLCLCALGWMLHRSNSGKSNL